jgi:hypothetical protein
VAVDAAGNECKPESAETGAALAKSTATQLAARKANLHARKLEHRRALRRGDLVELTRTGRLVERRFREIPRPRARFAHEDRAAVRGGR